MLSWSVEVPKSGWVLHVTDVEQAGLLPRPQVRFSEALVFVCDGHLIAPEWYHLCAILQM